MKLSKREIRLLVFALIIITTVSIIKWLIIPLRYQYINLDKEIYEAEHRIKMINLNLQNGRKYREKLRQIKIELAAIDKLFYHGETDKVKIRVMNVIDDYIKSSGLVIGSKDLFIERKLDKKIDIITYNLILQGNYRNLLSFLKLLNDNEKLMTVQRLDIKGGSSRTKLIINLLIRVINREGEDYVR